MMKTPNIAAIVHVYYPEFWMELAGCLRNIKDPFDLFVTDRSDSVGEERCVLRVDGPRSLFVHEGAHGYFYNIGSSKRKMPPDMLARLFQQRNQSRLICFDEQVIAGAELKLTIFSSPSEDHEALRDIAKSNETINSGETINKGMYSTKCFLLPKHMNFHIGGMK